MNKWISSAILISVFLALHFGSPHYAHAAWTNDPAVNTPIAADGGNDLAPAIVSDGHFLRCATLPSSNLTLK
jgi:hypothetical protein